MGTVMVKMAQVMPMLTITIVKQVDRIVYHIQLCCTTCFLNNSFKIKEPDNFIDNFIDSNLLYMLLP